MIFDHIILRDEVWRKRHTTNSITKNKKVEYGCLFFLSSSLLDRMEGKITDSCQEQCHISILVIRCCSLGF